MLGGRGSCGLMRVGRIAMASHGRARRHLRRKASSARQVGRGYLPKRDIRYISVTNVTEIGTGCGHVAAPPGRRSVWTARPTARRRTLRTDRAVSRRGPCKKPHPKSSSRCREHFAFVFQCCSESPYQRSPCTRCCSKAGTRPRRGRHGARCLRGMSAVLLTPREGACAHGQPARLRG